MYWGFVYNNSGTYVHMPLPDFTLVYFDYAYKSNIGRKEVQKTLLNKLADADTMTEDRSHELYQFYGVATSCIINLFTSIESFINHLLPENKVYTLEEERRTETYNREQIQRYLQFNEKLKKVIPQFLEKNFFQKQTPTTQHIDNLKDLRDALVHTKAGASFKNHTETFKKLLNFKYTKTFDAVVKLFNFYQPGYIEDCPCEKDF